MDSDLIVNFRNIILVGTLVTTASCVPDLSSRIMRPVIALRRLINSCQAYIQARLLEKRESGFWEIDMTKFEP